MEARRADESRAGRAWLAVVAMLLATMVAVVGAPAADAATFVVDSTADTGDAAAGNGVCANAGGDCTLRAAVEEANALAGADTITMPAGNHPVGLQFPITSDVTIVGQGSGATIIQATVDDNRSFHLASAGAALALIGLTLDGAVGDDAVYANQDDVTIEVTDVVFRGYGNVPICVCGGDLDGPDDTTVLVDDSTFDDNAYSILVSGPSATVDVRNTTIRSHAYALLIASAGGSFDLTDSTVTNTSPDDDPAGLEIYDGVTTTLTRSRIDGNDDSGVYVYAGSPSMGSTTIRDSTVDGNGNFGAVLDWHSTIRNSSVSGNARVGIDHGDGNLTIDRTTVAGNGHIGIDAVRGDQLSIVNTTISGNGVTEPENEWYGLGLGDYDSATVQNATVVGSPVGISAGSSGAPPVVRNTIVAGTLEACAIPVPSAGHNLTGDATCAFGAPGDIVGAQKLGSLADNGGTTLTRMPAADSPAVDAGTSTGCPASDQRGTTRPRDGDTDGVAVCDIGAVERGGAGAGTADLRLSKEADRSTAAIGQLVTYTLTATNAGPDTAPQARVTDPLPAGVVFSSSPDGCVEQGAAVTCDLGSLAPGASAARHIVVAVTDDGLHTNTATVSSAASDPTPGNDSASAIVQGTSPDGVTERIFGLSRIETAVAASQNTYGDGEAGAVVLARSDTFPDALAGAPLAVAHQAPLLLTETQGLHPATSKELGRVLPAGGTVHLLGGLTALGAEVEDAVRDLGYEVIRYPGADRYATAVLISEALGDPGAIFVATGRNFPDALAAGAAAAELGGVIVLTDDDVMVGSTADYIADHAEVDRYAIGGPSAGADPQATPVVGADRYATALQVATTFFEDPAVVGVAVGTNFPDALAGDTHIARRRAPMLLVDRGVLPGSVADYLAAHRASIRQVFVYGGEVAISSDVETAIAEALR